MPVGRMFSLRQFRCSAGLSWIVVVGTDIRNGGLGSRADRL